MKTESVKVITMAEFKRELASIIGQEGSAYAAARKIGVSHSMLSQVMSGSAFPGRKCLDYFGLDALRVFVPATRTSRMNGDE